MARFLVGLLKTTPTDMEVDVRRINGWPTIVVSSAGRTLALISIETDGNCIAAVRNVVNPEKLRLENIN